MSEKKKSALYGFCIGDALGAPVEFLTKDMIKKRYGTLTTYKSGFLGIPYFLKTAGSGTDDTRFLFALLNGIQKNKKEPLKEIAKEFNKLRLYPVFIGKNLLYDFLFYFGDWHKTSKFVHMILKGKTAGNGALMRSLAVALVYDELKEMIEITKIQAKMTHWNDISTECCVVYNTIAYYLLKGDSIKDAIEKATEKTEYRDFDINEILPNGYAPNTLKHVIFWLKETNNLEEAIVSAVNNGGDTDTIAALVGGLAGIYYGIENIPTHWIDKLKAKNKIEKIKI